jgi:hypothetical protein
MKKVILSLCLVILVRLVSGQDIIIKSNGEEIKANITETTSVLIIYQLADEPNGLSYNVKKSEIFMIKYKNGQKEIFNKIKTPKENFQNIDSTNNTSTIEVRRDILSLGIGLGMDYGGIGGSLLIYPQQNIGIFGGVGYAFAGTAYNMGVKLRMVSKTSKSPVVFYVLAMYGYNAAIAVLNASQYNKIFYGPTIGLGIDIGARPNKSGYWSLGLFFPVRGDEVDKYFTDLKNNHNIEIKNSLWPVAISIGYRFKLY